MASQGLWDSIKDFGDFDTIQINLNNSLVFRPYEWQALATVYKLQIGTLGSLLDQWGVGQKVREEKKKKNSRIYGKKEKNKWKEKN